MTNKQEVRYLVNPIECRNLEEDKKIVIVGYASKFNQESEVMYDFVEYVDSGAFDKTNMSDVRALIDHDSGKILGRTTANNLKLSVDEIGLRFEVEVNKEVSYVKDLVLNMQDGNINQCSFGFYVDEEEWDYDESRDLFIRHIKSISKLSDVSLVTYPAYVSTEAVVSMRGLDSLKNELERRKIKELLIKEMDKLELEIELMK